MYKMSDFNPGWVNSCRELQSLMAVSDPNELWVKVHKSAVSCNVVSDSNWQPDIEKLKFIADHVPLVIDCSGDPFKGHEVFLVEKLSEHLDHFTILTGDARYLDQPRDHICYFPYFFLICKYLGGPSDDLIMNHRRSYKLSCLNNRARVHRIENWIKIKEKKWFDQCLFSMHNDFDIERERLESGLDFSDASILEKFLVLKNSLPPRHINDLTVKDPAYLDSYINFVTETIVQGQELFLSEKSYKPLLSGQLGVWFSTPGTVRFLRRLGFDVFDDIVDHSYDLELDWHVRLNMLHDEIENLINLDLAEIFRSTQQRRLNNKKLFNDNQLYDKLMIQCNQMVHQ